MMHYKRLELNKCFKILNILIELRNEKKKKEFYSMWIPGIIKIVILTTIWVDLLRFWIFSHLIVVENVLMRCTLTFACVKM